MKVVKSRAFKDRLKGHKESVISLFSPYGHEGHMLYSISKDGSVRGWDLAKREITIKALLDKNLKSKDNKEEEAAFEGDGKEDKRQQEQKGQVREQLVSSCFTEKSVLGSFEDGTIIEWSFSNQGQIIKEYLGHKGRVNGLVIIGKELVSGGHDGTIRRWQLGNGEAEAVYKTGGPVNSIKQGEEGRVCAVVSRNIFYDIDLKTNSIHRCIKFAKHSITAFIYQDQQLVFGNIDNKLMVYDLSTYDPEEPQKLVPKKQIEGLGGWVLNLQLMNGQLFAGCDDRKIRVYDWQAMEEVEELGGHDDGIISLSFADNMLYSGSFDHSIRSWDIKEMQQRISDRSAMAAEDVESKKYEVYYQVVFKNKKKKLPSKKKK